MCAALGLVGCADTRMSQPYFPDLPRELQKVSLPSYVIEPPDILLIDAVAGHSVATLSHRASGCAVHTGVRHAAG
jgi:hypothetical protein